MNQMTNYEDGRIAVLASKLADAGVSPDLVEGIMSGGETIRKKDRPQKKAEWMKQAMARMDALLDVQTRHAVRESCACCLGGKREQICKAIAKTYESLEDRIRAASEAKLVFGHSVTTEEDGRILVRFSPDGEESYRCVCLPKADGRVSVTYCYCCGGHAKHHLQNALGRKLSVEVRSSALESGGERPCTFLFRVEERSSSQAANVRRAQRE